MDTALLLRGAGLGLAVAVPVGPIGILCIRRTLTRGRVTGFVSGLGAATADALYGSIAALGLTFVSDLLISHRIWMRLVGGVFLCLLGAKTFRDKTAGPAAVPGKGKRKGLLAAYASTLFLTLANPMTIVSFAAIFAAMGVAGSPGDYAATATLISGLFLGSTLWWLALSQIIGSLRHKLDETAVRWINHISGAAIACLGLALLLSLRA